MKLRAKIEKWYHDRKMEKKARTKPFDPKAYRNRYPDLAGMNESQLLKHWVKFGFKEGRIGVSVNQEQAGKDPQQSRDIEIPFDAEFYLSVYPELLEAGVTTAEAAEAHYREHGVKDGLHPSLVGWLHLHGLSRAILPPGFSWSAMLAIPQNLHLALTPDLFFRVLQGDLAIPLRLTASDKENAEAYVELAKAHILAGQRDKGKRLLQLSTMFDVRTHAAELIGNSFFDGGHNAVAKEYYSLALSQGLHTQWVYVNQAICLERLNHTGEALACICDGIDKYPQWTHSFDRLDTLCERRWLDFLGQANHLIDSNSRLGLQQLAYGYAEAVYEAYLHTHGVTKTPALGGINLERVLIIGDFGLKQCYRYRVEQKIEQLATAGITATAVSWQKLGEHGADVAAHDVVIFYRVPATREVIKMIAQVNACGKLSLYEIDDLLFDHRYPPALETYGGLVELDQYRGLMQGMSLFYAAARLCRLGIGSTKPLAEHLADVVADKRSLLHRNGLDKHSQVKLRSKRSEKVINIFYGSGTKAHNSDFIDIALPAIEKLLDEFSQVRLTVVGYLSLPEAFTSRYAKRINRYPVTSTIQEYWNYLQSADINLAVLYDDVLNGCKSEIKWTEAAWFGIPSVVSQTRNYLDVIEDGVDGIIVRSPEGWHKALRRLVVDSALRERMGRAAQVRVSKEYAVATLGQQLRQQLVEAAGPGCVAPTERTRTKLAIVNVFFPPQTIGGATRVVTDNFDELLEQYADEFELTVFTTDSECRRPYQFMSYMHRGVRVYRATVQFREHMEWHPTDPKMQALFERFLDLEQPDIVHFHCVQRLTGSVLEAALIRRIPYAVTIHDAWWISDYQFLVDGKGKVYPDGHPDPEEKLPVPAGLTAEGSLKRRSYLKNLLFSASCVLTVSEAFAQIYRKNGVLDVTVIKNGISTNVRWAPKDTSATPMVVCGQIGGMAVHKGYKLLREAVLKVQPRNLEFLIVDASKEEGYLLRDHWGKTPVNFIGRVKQNRVNELYSRLDVLFAPSIWPESFGLVTREAAACGCWVVASNMGGTGEDVVEGVTGHCIEPTLEALCEVLERIDAAPNKYKGVVKQGTSYTAADQVVGLVGLYRRLHSSPVEQATE